MHRREFLRTSVLSASAVATASQLHPLGLSTASAGAVTPRGRIHYVAPEARGDGSGRDRDNPAKWSDRAFRDEVHEALEKGDVTMLFLNGTYYVSSEEERELPSFSFRGTGHDRHRLILRGESPNGVWLARHPEDPDRGNEGPDLLEFRDCHNVAMSQLHFTAPEGQWIDYTTRLTRCRDFLVDGCSWVDMPNVHYGATGVHREESDGVTYRNCRFVRIGRRSGAHMAYNAWAPKRTSYINCLFEDCAGDYVRFRSGSEYNVVAGCIFRSTGNHVNEHMPFIAAPVFNPEGRGEVFGTNFLIFDNIFIYASESRPDSRIAFLFHHSGYDPPERRHLLGGEEARVLRSGSVEEKRKLLRETLGIDPAKVHVFNNRYHNVAHRGVYRMHPRYGAEEESALGDTILDISDTFSSEEVAASADEAPAYFQ